MRVIHYEERRTIIRSSPELQLPARWEGPVIRNWNRRAVTSVTVVLVLVLGYVVFRMRGVSFDWHRFAAGFAALDGKWLAVAVGLLYLTYLGRALRWRALMLPVCPAPSVPGLVSSTIVGFTAVTIFGRPGELVRPYLISVKEKVSFSSQLAIWLLERLYDLLAVVLLFGFALTQADSHAAIAGSRLDWVLRTGGYVVAGLGLACTAVLVFIGSFSGRAQTRIQEGLTVLPERHRARVERVLLAFAGGMGSTRSRGFAAQVLAYTIGEWLVITSCNYCLFKSFPATSHFTAVDNLVFTGFVAFGSVVQVPGIGGGFQVASIVMLTELFGLPLEAASTITVLIWLTMYVIVVPAGLVLAVSQGLQLGRLREMADERSSTS